MDGVRRREGSGGGKRRGVKLWGQLQQGCGKINIYPYTPSDWMGLRGKTYLIANSANDVSRASNQFRC